MRIHPTAIVDPSARLLGEVEIGPYSLVGSGVELGDGCLVQAHAVIEGWTTLGENNLVGHGAVIGAPPQDFAYRDSVRSGVRIGRGNTFREYVTIHRGTKEGTFTTVGNDCFVMAGVHFGHNVSIGDKAVIANNCLLAGYVEIGAGAVLGGGTVFHQFMRVGKLAMVRGGTRFGKDIPPFSAADGENMLSGINAIGLRRAGFSPAARGEIRRAFKLAFRSGLNISQVLKHAADSEWGTEARSFFDFLASSKRGVCLANRAPTAEEEGASSD